MSKPPIIFNLPLVLEPPVVTNPIYRLTAKDTGSCADRCYQDRDAANKKADRDYDNTMDEISCRYSSKHTDGSPCYYYNSHGRLSVRNSLQDNIWQAWRICMFWAGVQNPITFYGTMAVYYCTNGSLDNYPNDPYFNEVRKCQKKFDDSMRDLVNNLRNERLKAESTRDSAKAAAWLEFYDCCKTY